MLTDGTRGQPRNPQAMRTPETLRMADPAVVNEAVACLADGVVDSEDLPTQE